jgi:hypothetical protein
MVIAFVIVGGILAVVVLGGLGVLPALTGLESFGIGLLVAAAINLGWNLLLVGRVVDKPVPAYRLVPVPPAGGGEPQKPRVELVLDSNGHIVLIRQRSTFMFLPLTYWPVVLGVLGVLLIFLGITDNAA